MQFHKNLLNIAFCKPISSFRFASDCAHTPVLNEEVVKFIGLDSSKNFIDMTFGAGGHSRAILQKFPDAKVYALDRDPVAYNYAQRLSEEYRGQVIPMLGKFSDLPRLLKNLGVKQKSFDGILFDLGCSSMQYDSPERGFSLSKNGPLDMRMGGDDRQITAADVLARTEEADLAKILRIYGQEKAAKRIARAIVESRSLLHKVETTKQLADLVSSCVSQAYRLDKLQRRAHSATLTFQAIRIFINNELNEINYGMILAQRYLKVGGRLVTITFHSLEDTIVKRHINGNIIEGLANPIPLKYSGHDIIYDRKIVESLSDKNWRQLHKHVVVPTDDEVMKNKRSRSAKLRAAEKLK